MSVSNIYYSMIGISKNEKTDPSSVKQHFPAVFLKIHCCRYWKLSEWEFRNMSFPFWRIYYNTIEGARVYFDNQVVELKNDIIVLIPPYTSFSTSLKKWDKESLNGSRIQSWDEYQELGKEGMVDHLFVHFNLGYQHDWVEPGIYVFDLSPGLKELLDDIRAKIIDNDTQFSFNETMLLHRMVFRLVSRIPDNKKVFRQFDKRILNVIEYIDSHMQEELNNDHLASIATMATNSFIRFFRQVTGFTLQQFVQNKRIEKSVTLLHNQSGSIDQIADWCGFSDRHHFSKVFKKQVGVSPGAYKRMHTIGY